MEAFWSLAGMAGAAFVAATLLGVPPRSPAVAAVLDGAAYVES